MRLPDAKILDFAQGHEAGPLRSKKPQIVTIFTSTREE
jgi:hypothetical protein